MTDHIWHITITTGDSHKSPRSGVDAGALQLVADHLSRALEADSPLPGDTGCHLMATASGPWLVATVLYGDAPLVTMGVAPQSQGAGRLWRTLHADAKTATDPADVPRAPWCAVRIEPGLLQRLDAAQWLGDYERLLAWAWLDMQRP